MSTTYKALEVSAPDLAKLAIEAHGGLDRWRRFTTLSVHGINGGVLWGAKGKAGVLDDVTVTVDLRNEKVSHWPFGSSDRRSRFEPQRVALENARGFRRRGGFSLVKRAAIPRPHHWLSPSTWTSFR